MTLKQLVEQEIMMLGTIHLRLLFDRCSKNPVNPHGF